MGKTRIVRQLRNGQITIPKEFRDALHLGGEEVLVVTLQDGKLEIGTVRQAAPTGGSQWAKDLYDLYAPVRKSLEGYTEQEINDAIDEAVQADRAERR